MSENRNVDIWIAGAFAAFSVDIIIYPLDTIKTRMQSPKYHQLYRNASNTAFKPAMFRGVYQGVGSVILATLPSSGAFFTTYEGVKSILSTSQTTSTLLPQPVIHATASGLAELVSCALLTPAEVIKQNAQMVDPSASSSSSSSKSPSTNATLQTLSRFRSHPLSLWRGYGALASRNLPFTALQFPLFERLKTAIYTRREERGVRSHSLVESATVTAVSAGLAGSVAAVVTTPVDVVKTRIMLAAGEEGEGKVAEKGGGKVELVEGAKKAVGNVKGTVVEAVTKPGRLTSVQIVREVMAEHGVKGLFRGGALRGVWTMLGSGLYLGAYEGGRLWLAKQRGEELKEEDLT